MKRIITIATSRDSYSMQDVTTTTVYELIKALKQFDENDKIVFCNDGGYTYGYIDTDAIKENYIEE